MITGVATFALLLAGASVTSTGSGLAVPDWPLSYGSLFPEMKGGVFFEHGHRVIAGVVALLFAGLAVWARRAESRRSVRRLAYAAFALVLVQAVLGGLTVLLLLPPAISVAHAATGMAIFCLIAAFATVTSPSWREAAPGEDVGRLSAWAVGVALLVYLQILLGAVMRHTGAGLACPDFPLCHGQLVPPLVSPFITVHFLHRLGGVLSALAVLGLTVAVERRRAIAPQPVALARFAGGVVVLQFALGVASILTRLSPPVTVAHHGGGALLLATLVALALRASRSEPREASAAVPLRGLEVAP